jgi:hypothetical protein
MRIHFFVLRDAMVAPVAQRFNHHCFHNQFGINNDPNVFLFQRQKKRGAE